MNACIERAAVAAAVPGNRGPLLGERYIRGFLQGAILRGHDPTEILEKSRIPPDTCRDPSARMDGVQLQRLLATLEREMNDAFMGFTEQPAKLAMYREQSRVRFQCARLGEAIKMSTQFREAVRNDVCYEYRCNRRNHEFTLAVKYSLRPECDPQVFYFHRLMTIYKYHCWLVGKRIQLNRVSFTFADPGTADGLDFQRLFQCEVRFDQPENSLTMPSNELRCPVVRSEMEQIDFVENYPDWFTIPGEDRSWARRVEREILHLQAEGVWCPTIARVAERLSIAPRSLRRQLSREHDSFQAIKVRLRRDVAIRLLVTTDMPVTLVAGEIGFAEPGDFTRAFKAWMNCTPSDYRSKYANDKDAIASTMTNMYRLNSGGRLHHHLTAALS